MGRFKKKNLLQIAAALISANDSMGKAASADVQEAAAVLTECQKAAIQMGNLLEAMGEGYVPLVKLLEDYCENVYQMSICFSDEIPLASREKEIRKLYKRNRKLLQQLRNSITYDMPDDRKEVVFLPYKASMWDSLESVWRAAEEDENTDAYVIPIPYFDKNPDQSFREEHYEGELFPDYVPITKYDEYDFGERRPDAIFIHNPYDDCNIVTSVHPFFYSKNLKKFTDKLVYVPYFILDEVDPEDDERVEGIKHLVIPPAVFHSDKVVVQSENMKKAYIRILLGQTEQPSENVRKYWEEKILGLGSPKLDKMRRTDKTTLKIPDKWKKLIEKPDGKNKRIILYNIGVGALLQHGGQLLVKMEKVFKIFKERKDDIVLLWRPHPLMESTLTAMRPQLYERYMELRRRYLEEGWGIYDDTTDVERAMILSDAYYGDWSSIVTLYRETGKPIMIQNVEIEG